MCSLRLQYTIGALPLSLYVHVINISIIMGLIVVVWYTPLYRFANMPEKFANMVGLKLILSYLVLMLGAFAIKADSEFTLRLCS